MPSTPNKEFQRIRPIPDGLLPNTEVFFLSSTNEVFLDYDDYFNRMIQLNSSCWRCTMTGRSGLTYDEALKSERDAIKRRKKREEAKGKKLTLSPTTSSGSRVADEARKKRQIHEQQQQLEPLFRQAEKAGVEQMDRWRQSRRLLNDSHIVALREAIQAAKEAERRRQLERQRREREALAEWRKPRDDLLCEDLKPFPEFKKLCWPDWVPSEHYWDILAISTFCYSFAPLLIIGNDHQRGTVPYAFSVPQIATALVSRQISEGSCFYKLLDTLLNAFKQCIPDDDGPPADLSNPDQVGNEAVKDFDHPIHGPRIRAINRECHRQFKLHSARVWELSHDFLNLSEVIRQFLLTAGFYTKWRRQTRGFMHCYEDDGYLFVQQHADIVELLGKVSVYALSPAQRVQLITTLMDQLLSHSSFRKLIDERIDALAELRKRLKHIKTVDQQHEKEVRDALQHIQQKTDGEQQHEESVVDKDEQKARAAAQRELVQLRRALLQLNEGRRVKEIGDLRERLLDAQRPLPWRAMSDAREVREFRAMQRHFHEDKMQELLREIYQLQGKMGMFLLGRDRAFRSYYYMNSAFIILCPRGEEIGGHCWGEGTPAAKNPTIPEDSGTEGSEVENGGRRKKKKVGRDQTLLDGWLVKGDQTQSDIKMENRRSASSCSVVAVDYSDVSREIGSLKQQNGIITTTNNKIIDTESEKNDGKNDSSAVENGTENKKIREEEVEKKTEGNNDCSPLDPLMRCTGAVVYDNDGMGQCPVHNPSQEWPRLLFYMEVDGVWKLLNALNPRGFREAELADSIALFRDFYDQEMTAFADSMAGTAASVQLSMLGAHLFGFGRTVPKELREPVPAELDLFDQARERLLELENQLFEHDFGTPHCSTSREEWRTALETYGDTSMLCRGNCIPLIRPTSPLNTTMPSSTLNTSIAHHQQNVVVSADHENCDDGAASVMHEESHQQQNGLAANMDIDTRQYQQHQQQNFLYTREQLSNTNTTPLSRVQKLGIALMQLVHGIRRECFFDNNFMITVKRNGTVTKKPTSVFVEWQQALKECQSPSAISLFETTLEFAIDWEFKDKIGTIDQQPKLLVKKTAAVGRRRRGDNAKTVVDENAMDGPTTSAQRRPRVRQRREVNNLLVEASYLGGMAIGARKRKPVTKYGDVEMDVDKLNFEEEEDEQQDQGQQQQSDEYEGKDGEIEEEEEEDYKEEEEDDEEEDSENNLL